jgi:hypothetical protein
MVIPPSELSFDNSLATKDKLTKYLNNCKGFKHIMLFLRLFRLNIKARLFYESMERSFFRMV